MMTALSTRIAQFSLLTLLLTLLFALGGCNQLQVHKVEVQQGNVVTQQMIDTLRPGMSRRQVAFVMGEPVLRDALVPDRWDYVFSIPDHNRTTLIRRISLYFEDDALVRLEGQLMADDVLRLPTLSDLLPMPAETRNLPLPGADD